MKAKKSLGQHFLKSEKALSQIVDAGNIHADDVVLEIGPGQGVLTERLLKLSGKVVAVEKDRELIPLLKEKFAKEIKEKKFELIEADILNFNPVSYSLFSTHSYKLIANIPYYITGAIIEQFLSTPYQPKQMVLLVQKEVAQRIVAKDKKESVLSVAVRAYGTPRIIATVPAGAFAPAPKVDSAIISIEGISRDFFKQCNEELFFKTVKFIFGRKRKQIEGSLSELLGNRALAKTILGKSNIASTARPEELSLATWKVLVTHIENGQ